MEDRDRRELERRIERLERVVEDLQHLVPVSYTHLTLPTN